MAFALKDRIRETGIDIPAALASSQAAALRMNDVLKTINTTIRSGAATFANDFVTDLEKGQSVLASLEAAAVGLGKTLQTAGLNSLVTSGLNAVLPGASQTAGATSSATILTTAGTALAASMVAGATSAAAILAGGGTAAGGELSAGATAGGIVLGVGGKSAGGDTAAGGIAGGAGLEAGGAAAGAALWGPIAAIGAVAIGIGMVLGANKQEPRDTDSLTSETRQNLERNNFSKAA
jgi:hypothetical protein